MVDQSLARQNGAPTAGAIESVIALGDLSKLTSEQRSAYYARVCESLGLNPLTRPFEYLTLQGKLILYARKDCTDQLRSVRKVSLSIASREMVEGLYVVTARATLPDGRTDEEIGAVNIKGLQGDALANAMMKASTKAKRRVTLSVCGLGMLDETETETIPEARVHVEQPAALPARTVDHETGEIVTSDAPKAVLDAARELYREAKAAGIDVQPPAAKDADTVAAWSADVRHRLEVQRGNTGDPDDVEAGAPAWADSALGGAVMALADELDAVNARYHLPPSEATDADLEGWIAAKRGLLHARRGA